MMYFPVIGVTENQSAMKIASAIVVVESLKVHGNFKISPECKISRLNLAK